MEFLCLKCKLVVDYWGRSSGIYSCNLCTSFIPPLVTGITTRVGNLRSQLMLKTIQDLQTNSRPMADGTNGKTSKKCRANIQLDTIVKVDFASRPLRAYGDSGTTYIAQSVIIATGATAKWLGIPSESEFMG